MLMFYFENNILTFFAMQAMSMMLSDGEGTAIETPILGEFFHCWHEPLFSIGCKTPNLPYFQITNQMMRGESERKKKWRTILQDGKEALRGWKVELKKNLINSRSWLQTIKGRWQRNCVTGTLIRTWKWFRKKHKNEEETNNKYESLFGITFLE